MFLTEINNVGNRKLTLM